MKKPLIAYILRKSSAVKHILLTDKDYLEMYGYEVITGHSLDDIPRDRVKDLDLLIAHLHEGREVSLEEQAKLRDFHGGNFKFVVRLGTLESMRTSSFDTFGKTGNSYYMRAGADIVEAVKYFLEN